MLIYRPTPQKKINKIAFIAKYVHVGKVKM